MDSKQITDGSFRLGSSNDGMQLSRNWIEMTVLPKLDPNSDAAKAVQKYIDGDATLKTAVAGLDKATGEFKVVMVDVPSGN